ncbi:ACT domain-containing protein [Cetobacterium sp.]|uniref:ACT domain-containing protein n=1 Tax=Cetobacterium sp. TaxID=2071632 RepID=UPI003F346B39
MNGKFLVVDKSILPDYLEKVIAVRNLLEEGKSQNVSEAVKIVGISRSTYYKYKDFVFLPSDNAIGKKALISLMVSHQKGALSEILNFLSSVNCNIITINQNIPINNVASVVISFEIASATLPPEDIVQELKKIDCVKMSRLLAFE